jgi:hypothetical protein
VYVPTLNRRTTLPYSPITGFDFEAWRAAVESPGLEARLSQSRRAPGGSSTVPETRRPRSRVLVGKDEIHALREQAERRLRNLIADSTGVGRVVPGLPSRL